MNKRRSLLPTTLETCELADTDEWDLYPHRWEHHGFDQSGQYYSILDGPQPQNYSTQKVSFLSYNNNEKKIEKRFVVLERGNEMMYDPDFHYSDCVLYDANLTRWFSITPRDERNENGKYEIVVNSGCITTQPTGLSGLESGTTINMDELNDGNHLILEFDKKPRVIRFLIKRDTDHGCYLILFTCPRVGLNDNDKTITIDLIKYNSESISHYRRIALNHPQKCDIYVETKRFGYDNSVFFDFQSGQIFIIDCRRLGELPGERKHIWDSFNFDGNLVFSHEVEEGNNEWSYQFFTHLRGDFFIAATSELNVKLLRITVNGIIMVKQYLLTISVPPSSGGFATDFRVNNYFQRDILEVKIRVLEEVENGITTGISNQIHVFDVSSGIQIINPLELEKDVSSFAFNWSLEEIMYTSGYIYFSETSEMHIDTQSHFVKTQSTDISLKHQARLASLRHFSGEFLNSKLPKTLVEYLSI